jgi:hypothetical protein
MYLPQEYHNSNRNKKPMQMENNIKGTPLVYTTASVIIAKNNIQEWIEDKKQHNYAARPPATHKNSKDSYEGGD